MLPPSITWCYNLGINCGAIVKQSKARKLRAANYQGTDREWEAVLQWTFLRKELEPEEAKLLQGVEAVASVEGEELKITLRKNISGITQRLGTIPLVQNEDEEIAPVEWALIAAKEAGDAATTISTLHAKLAEQQETVSKLNASLDDLIKAKKEHEDKLLQKFTELLNSKKLKIRDQQRLLAGAKIDSSTGKMLLIRAA